MCCLTLGGSDMRREKLFEAVKWLVRTSDRPVPQSHVTGQTQCEGVRRAAVHRRRRTRRWTGGKPTARTTPPRINDGLGRASGAVFISRRTATSGSARPLRTASSQFSSWRMMMQSNVQARGIAAEFDPASRPVRLLESLWNSHSPMCRETRSVVIHQPGIPPGSNKDHAARMTRRPFCLTNPAETRSLVSMLASLLPGLRDLRAPLAGGFIWLLLA
jgi:hypothetical protein